MERVKLALSLPWNGGTATINPGYNPAPAVNPATTTLGTAVSSFGEIAIYIGGFLMFFWAVWGVFDYIRAEGNKEGLAKARKRIQWAIVGFIILLLSFLLSGFLQGILLEGMDLNERDVEVITPPSI